ncbi:hypothetical protein APHAL10511_008220 [Amanita phalloides]|nr:hypothetical protein APHAL10511_008220 [Amanita phalloides]
MQSQHYNVPPHPGYYNATQNSYPTSQDQFTASNVGDFASFSRGSSLVYPDYQYFSDRGAPSRHSTNFADSHSTDAAVSGFTENSSPGVDMSYRPEDILAYQQSWQWSDTTMHDTSVPIPGPMYSSADIVKNPVDYSFMDVSTPIAHLPTPAMAITGMHSHSSQVDVRNHSQMSYQESSSQISTQTPATVVRTSRTESGPGIYAVPDSQLREKKHACTMCHKRSVKYQFLVIV